MVVCIKHDSSTKLIICENEYETTLRINRQTYSLYVGTILTNNLSLNDIVLSLQESYKDIDLSKSDRDLLDYLLDNSSVQIRRSINNQ